MFWVDAVRFTRSNLIPARIPRRAFSLITEAQYFDREWAGQTEAEVRKDCSKPLRLLIRPRRLAEGRIQLLAVLPNGSRRRMHRAR